MGGKGLTKVQCNTFTVHCSLHTLTPAAIIALFPALTGAVRSTGLSYQQLERERAPFKQSQLAAGE